MSVAVDLYVLVRHFEGATIVKDHFVAKDRDDAIAQAEQCIQEAPGPMRKLFRGGYLYPVTYGRYDSGGFPKRIGDNIREWWDHQSPGRRSKVNI